MPIIQDVQHLRQIIGEPNELVPRKLHRRLNAQATEFIARSRMLFLATSNADGEPTVSPKGDAPGFVRVADAQTLLIPERKGNKLIFSLQNILTNPGVGLIFVVPGSCETLRVMGRGELVDDLDLCESFAERGKPALLVTRVRVTQAYFHCAKAFLRSELWNQQSWPAQLAISFGKEIAQEGGLAQEEIASFDVGVQQRYQTDL